MFKQLITGHIRVFNFNEGVMSAEITAHARWINAIDVNARGLVSCFWSVNLFNFLLFDLIKFGPYYNSQRGCLKYGPEQ